MATLSNFLPQPHVVGKSREWDPISYIKIEKIGSGKRRVCWKAIESNFKVVAVVKEVFKKFEIPEILHYTHVLETLKGHPNIVDVRSWFWAEQRKDKHFKFIQIQTCYDGNLVDAINQRIFDGHPEWIKPAFLQLAEGLEFIHSKNAVINDLKGDNIFWRLENSSIHLVYGDFGGTDLPNKSSKQNTLTENYCSPSRLEDGLKTQADDVFGLGICYASIQQSKINTLNFPYQEWLKNKKKEYAEHVEEYACKLDETEWKPLICQMLAYERLERPAALQIKAELSNITRT